MPQTTHLASTRLRGGWALLAAIVLLATAGATSATAPAAGSARIPAYATVARDTALTAPDLGRALGENIITDAPVQAQPAPRAVVTAPVAAPVVVQKATVLPSPSVSIATANRYVGTNRVWMPALGINRPVYLYACTRSTALDNLVYRWGCAGRNNTYLMGHAWGVFKPLHDAYEQGRLRVGMELIYADGASRIQRYRITTWRVVLPTDVSWIGSFSVPTMILQTCIGATSTYRLNVKLVAVS
jgi:sortase (surface protein transpeptidase)